MKYKSYQHIEKYGKQDTDGILDGLVYVQPKIDGTNSCVWLEEEQVHAGSRKRELSIEKDNADFYLTIKSNENIKNYLLKHPSHILYGEWLVPHTIRTYNNDAWKKFYIFDVVEERLNEDNEPYYVYLSYDVYKPLLEEFNLLYIPTIAVLNKPKVEDIIDMLKDNHYLIDGKDSIGEGLVIKRYDYKNKYGRTIWAKFIAEEFFDKKQKLRSKNHELKSADLEIQIANLVSDAFIKKEHAKVLNEYPDINRQQLIGRTINQVYAEFIREEIADIIIAKKNCVINFGTLKNEITKRIREVLPDLFSRQQED